MIVPTPQPSLWLTNNTLCQLGDDATIRACSYPIQHRRSWIFIVTLSARTEFVDNHNLSKSVVQFFEWNSVRSVRKSSQPVLDFADESVSLFGPSGWYHFAQARIFDSAESFGSRSYHIHSHLHCYLLQYLGIQDSLLVRTVPINRCQWMSQQLQHHHQQPASPPPRSKYAIEGKQVSIPLSLLDCDCNYPKPNVSPSVLGQSQQ